MERISLAPNGPTVSRIVYGTWRLLEDSAAAAPQPLVERLHACVDVGITTVDTAEIYGKYDVEEQLGRALRLDQGLRNKLEIVTKCGIYIPVPRHPDRKVAFYDVSAARIIKSAEKSLRLLGTDRLDVLLVHRPDWLTAADDTAEGLERLIEQGKIRAAGVSNYNVHQFELLQSRMKSPLVTNQVELSLFQMHALFDGTLDQCQRLRRAPMAWSPLGGGRLFRDGDEAAARLRTVMAELGPAYARGGVSATPEQLAYAWIVAHPSRPVVVIGTNKKERALAAAHAADIQLAREDWFRLWEAAQGRRIP